MYGLTPGLTAVFRRAVSRLSPRLAAHLKLWSRTGERGRAREEFPTWDGGGGVDYREGEQLERLRRWGGYGELFAALRRDPAITRGVPGGPIRNPWFATPDAEVYAAMLADLRPREIVEVGAGFSTLVARRAVRELGLDSTITVFDPFPRTDVTGAADHVVRLPIQRADVDSIGLSERGVLFVDSTHVTVPLGDVPYVYNCVIPRLPPGATVHVHDVFLPFDYPEPQRRRLYTEQYLVHALLSGSDRYRVLFATYLMGRAHPEELDAAIPMGDGAVGGSFWFRVEPEARAL